MADAEAETAAGVRSGSTAVSAVLGVALVLRLCHWAAVRTAPFVAQLAMDSQEYDRWARSIAAGDWLGHGVFFQAPLYPYLLAALYRLWGPRLDAVYLFQIAAGVAGCYALYRAGRASGGERVGLAAAALAAVYGPFLFYDVQLLKESLAASVACCLLWALTAAWLASAGPAGAAGVAGAGTAAGAAGATTAGGGRGWGWGCGRRGLGAWVGVGALCGVLALLRENMLLVVPFLAPLAWLAGGGGGGGAGPGGRWRAAAGRTVALAAGVVLVLAPVALRNGLVGGDFLPTTSQGGVNFYIGNNAKADGTYRPIVPGKQIPELERREPARIAEERLGRPLAAAEVSRYWLGQGLAWAAADPGGFLRLLGRKVGLYFSWYEWPDAVDYYEMRRQSPVYRLPLLEFGGVTLLAALGLAFLRGGRARRFAPALLFSAGWLASTVVFFLFARYRLPGVPALLLLAALPVAAALDAAAAGRRSLGRLAGLGVAVVAALVLPRLAGYAPRQDLVHFNLARLAEERGDLDGARRDYEAVLAVAPDDFLAWLDLGNLAARGRDWPAALRCFGRAAALEPGSDDAESNLGGVYLALGDPARASPHLVRALELNPRSVQALQNSALLRFRQGDLEGARELNRRALALQPGNPAVQRLHARLGGG